MGSSSCTHEIDPAKEITMFTIKIWGSKSRAYNIISNFLTRRVKMNQKLFESCKQRFQRSPLANCHMTWVQKIKLGAYWAQWMELERQWATLEGMVGCLEERLVRQC